jgi:alpha-tubulin suppressor-like RCC1 family protein
LDDILIGAYNYGWDQTGKAYLILAASLGSDSEIDLSLADYSFNGEHTSAYAGDSVSSAGDVDGDGLADILVGSDGYGPDAHSTGRAYVILGTSLGSTSEIDLADADYIFEGESSGDSLGESVSGAGDVDGDGLDDILVGKFGNRGKAYLLLAASLDGSSTMDSSDADYSFVGESDADKAGYSVATAGDVNGDGLPDIIIGAHGDGAGKAYLLLSPNTCNTPPRGTAVSISASGADSELVCVIDTEAYDAEDDLISYSFEWTVDGEPFTDTDSTTHADDTVAGSATTEGEEWTCTVTPYDGDAWGAPATASHVVLACDEDGDGLLALACGGGDCDDTDFDTGVCWSSVGPGAIHSCGLRTDGEVLCWGDNTYEQSSPPSDSFTMVEARGYGDSSHSCGLTVDGAAKCWGSDSYGESSPPDTPFQSVSVGRRHTCALTLSGNAVCWGDNESGQSTPPSTTFTSLNAGESHNCAVATSGLVECWGYNASGQSTPPEGTFQSVSAGDNHTCGLAADNSVLCWGANSFGETSPPSGSFVAVTAGGYFSCALDEAGDAQCWGADHHGQASPPDTTFETIRGGGWHTCGTTPSGDIECWGADDYGQSTPPEL